MTDRRAQLAALIDVAAQQDVSVAQAALHEIFEQTPAIEVDDVRALHLLSDSDTARLNDAVRMYYRTIGSLPDGRWVYRLNQLDIDLGPVDWRVVLRWAASIADASPGHVQAALAVRAVLSVYPPGDVRADLTNGQPLESLNGEQREALAQVLNDPRASPAPSLKAAMILTFAVMVLVPTGIAAAMAAAGWTSAWVAVAVAGVLLGRVVWAARRFQTPDSEWRALLTPHLPV